MCHLNLAIVCLLILMGPLLPMSSRADTPLRIIVPFPPGGVMDKMGRAVSAELIATSLSKPMVENRPGADGLIAIDSMFGKGEVGVSLLMVGPYFTTLIASGKLSADKSARFKPLIHLGDLDIYLIANGRLPLKSPLGLSIPVSRPWSCASTGGQFTTICDTLERAYPGNVISVPYRGEAQALNDILAGHVDLMPITGTVASQHLAAGTVSLIANLSRPQDHPLDTPATMMLFRSPIKSFYGFMVTSDVPLSSVDQLNRKINKALKSKGIQAAAHAVGMNLAGGSPSGLETVLRDNAAFQIRMRDEIR
jgi:tripartite-type tricarboxylate transporter receptor subunit TctC